MKILTLALLASLSLSLATPARADQAADGEAPAASAPLPIPVARKAAAPEQPWNGITINPVLPFLAIGGYRELQGSYERVMSERISLMATFAYGYGESKVQRFSGAGIEEVSLRATAWGLRLHPHFYFVHPAPGGFYLAPFVSLMQAGAELDGNKGSAFGWEGGGTLGWSWVAGAFNAKLGIGARYVDARAEVQTSSGVAVSGRQQVLPALDLQIGFVF